MVMLPRYLDSSPGTRVSLPLPSARMYLELGGETVLKSWGKWLILALVVLGLVTVGHPSSAQEPTTLVVSAAASLKDVLGAVEGIYQPLKPGVKIQNNFGSSGALEQQIIQGAPVDIFLAASPREMDLLQRQHLLLPGTRRDLLSNTLVLITPRSASSIHSFRDLTQGSVHRIALGDPRSVPAGDYGRQVLQFFGLLEQLRPKLVYGQDVRQVLSYVETGNVDAGLVYLTDARTSSQVRVVAVAPPQSHQPIIYPGAVINSSSHPQAAEDFLDFLTQPPARKVFDQAGFKLLPLK